jgi:predicted phosphodiesterase
MEFQYFSDIHTELYSGVECPRFQVLIHDLKPIAPYLILAGDIGHPFSDIYKEFLELVAKKFKRVFLIAGNHEYYTKNGGMRPEAWMSYVDTHITGICREIGNVTYLQNQVYHFPAPSNLSIFGGTFWSLVKHEEENTLRTSSNDLQNIQNLTYDTIRMLHYEACTSLAKALVKHSDRIFLVVSHHLPSYSLVASKYKSCSNSSHASEIELWKHDRIKAWVAGHTHIPIVAGKFHVNPIGHFGENIDKDFCRKIEMRHT